MSLGRTIVAADDFDTCPDYVEPMLAFTVSATLPTPVDFTAFRGHLSARPVWVGQEDGVHVQAKGVPPAVSGRVSS